MLIFLRGDQKRRKRLQKGQRSACSVRRRKTCWNTC